MRVMRAVATLLCLFLLSGPGSAAAVVQVFVSVLPLAYFADRVGGERVRVEALVGPGQNPALYDPSPRQRVRLAQADLFVRVGVPYEAGWMPRIQAGNPAMRVIDARDGLALLALPRHDEGVGEDAGDGEHANDPDPHVWTDPARAARIAAGMRDALVALDPDGRADYDANLAALQTELAGLDAELRGVLASVRGRIFLVFHPSWGYFAAAYGMEQMAIERLGKTPGPQALARLVDRTWAKGIRVILVQPQFSRKTAEAVAAAIGAQVVTADPLAYDYPSALRQLARLLAEGVSG